MKIVKKHSEAQSIWGKQIHLGIALPLFFLLIGIGFTAGWIVKSFQPSEENKSQLKALRLDGYKFISPLLVCDTTSEEKSEKLKPTEEKVSEFIAKQKAEGKLDEASVYFRDFNSGESLEINPDAKYYPASLNKIPVMMTAYKMAETDPALLSKKIDWQDNKDYNAGQEIQPKDFLKVGNQYSIEEALYKLINSSDNNAFYFLANNLDSAVFKATYSDLKIPMRDNVDSPPDYMTAKDFSYFLRVLYNSTYLKKEYSEKALEILSGVDFKDGIVAGVPAGTQISHKFGIQTNYDGEKPKDRELHDCGIVYQPDKPYLLCIMTKSSASLTDNEAAIKDISNLVYNEAAKR